LDGGLGCSWFSGVLFTFTFYLIRGNMKNIATALVKAQKAFGPALKSSTNPHFKSRYADLAACVEAVIDALNDNGIALVQHSHECADGIIIETIFIHESGEMISGGKLHVPATKQDAQGYGSAMTYARRYSLQAACGIAPEDDDGNKASRPAKPISTRTKAEIEAQITATTSSEQLTAVWKALPPEEREVVRDLAAKHNDKLKGAQSA
jgi:hypothetical protein